MEGLISLLEGELVLDSIKTYYYVCQPHANMGMKGVIISSEAPCNKSIEQSLKGFNLIHFTVHGNGHMTHYH